MKKLYAILLAAILGVGCQSIDEGFEVASESQLRELSIWVASSSEDDLSTKVSVNDNWEVSWDANEQLGAWSIDSPTTKFAQFSASNEQGETLVEFSGWITGEKLRLVYPYDPAESCITSYGRYPVSVQNQRVDLTQGNELNHLTESMCMMTEALEVDDEDNVETFALRHVGAVFNINITAQNLADQATIQVRSVELSEVPITGNLDLCAEGWDDPLPVDMYGTLAADVANAPAQGEGEEITIPVAIFPFGMSAGESISVKISYTTDSKYYTVTRTITTSSDINFARSKYHNLNIICDVATAEEVTLLGSGYVDDPYQIWTASDLEFMAENLSTLDDYHYDGCYYKLMQDINLGGSSSNQWGGIGSDTDPFTDYFDGNGFCVSGIYINKSTDHSGLFYYTNGARIYNLGVAGTISGGEYCGGIVGYARSTYITNCYNTCTISGTTGVGGIVGSYYSSGGWSMIINSYNSGKITSSSIYVGGIAGQISTAINCYNSGNISGNTSSYYIPYISAIAYSDQLAWDLDNCFYLNSCGFTEDDATSVSSTYLQSSEIVELLNARAISYNEANYGSEDYIEAALWQQNSGGYPTLVGTTAQWLVLDRWSGSGTADDPYKINKKSDLKQLNYWTQQGETFDNCYFEVTTSFDLEGSAEDPWTPILDFEGNFDGCGHTISGLYIDSDEDYQGLFGKIEKKYLSNSGFNSEVKNLYIEGEVRGGSYVGGVVGYSGLATDLYNCRFTGSVSGTEYVGGITGYALGRVDYCYTAGSVEGTNYVGGAVGSSESYIANCYNSSSVTASGQYVGGIVGSFSNTSYLVANSLNCGSVSGGDYMIGGIVGYGSAVYSYNTGTVSGTANFGPIVNEDGSFTTHSSKGCCYSSTCGATSSTSSGYTCCISLTDEYMRSEEFLDQINTASKAYNDQISGYYKSYYSAGTTRLWEATSGGYPKPIETMATGACQLEGEGSKESPYLVSSKSDLENLRTLCVVGISFSDSYFSMTQDIDLKCDADNQWTPIGTSTAAFSGYFDGCGHEISGLYIDSTTTLYGGVFGYAMGGSIVNLGVVDCYVKALIYSSTILGASSYTYCTVANCYASGTVSSVYYYAAGISAYSSSSKTSIYNSYSNVNFVDLNETVAAAGISTSNTYENCYYLEGCGDNTGYAGASSESYMQSEAMVEALNSTAAELNSTYDLGCLKWVYNQGGWPTLSTEVAE